jgi:hypothetical protein
MDTKVSKLDLFYKGIYPCLVLTLAAASFYFFSYDKQKQINQLQTDMKTLTLQQQETCQQQLVQAQQIEHNLQNLRIGYFRAMQDVRTADVDTEEVKRTKYEMQAMIAIQMAKQQRQEAKLFGEEKTAEFWEKARKTAAKEIMDWATAIAP